MATPEQHDWMRDVLGWDARAELLGAIKPELVRLVQRVAAPDPYADEEAPAAAE